MVHRPRIKYTAEQRADIWDHWQRGESLNAIGRLLDRASSSIFKMLVPSGGIRPPPRKCSRLALTLAEREEISRGIFSDLSVRAIADQLGRSASTISRVSSQAESQFDALPWRVRAKQQAPSPGDAVETKQERQTPDKRR